ncbi:oxidation resistance protein 1 [Coemansia sp. RSA 2603]|nr:oxidation resistance protein 1 [Coemansia sp. RSA 2603]
MRIQNNRNIPISYAKGTRGSYPQSCRSCEPLVSLSKTTVECRITENETLDHHGHSPPSLSSTTSSFFDVESFSSKSFPKPQNEFEQIFSVLPETPELPPTNLTTFVIDCADADSGPLPPPNSDTLPLKHSYTAPAALIMNLRNSIRDTDTNSGSSDDKRPRSFASRLLHFGLGGHGADHQSSPTRENSRSVSSSSHDFDAMTSSISTVHSTSRSNDEEGDNGAAMQFTEYGNTSQATREAMDTSILHDNGSSDTAAETATAPPAMNRQHSAFRRPVQLLNRNDDTPKVLTATIAEELLPVQQRLSKSWRLVYSMDQQGISMNTMLTLCSGEREMLLAIKDSKGKVCFDAAKTVAVANKQC